MTNKEKYREILENYTFVGIDWYVNEKKEISECHKIECDICRFCDAYCKEDKLIWLMEEAEKYKEENETEGLL